MFTKTEHTVRGELQGSTPDFIDYLLLIIQSMFSHFLIETFIESIEFTKHQMNRCVTFTYLFLFFNIPVYML